MTAFDVGSSKSTNIKIKIIDQVPVIQMMPDTFMFTVGDLYDGSEMRLVNSGGPAVTFTVSDLPQGLHLNGSSGSIYGSPTEEAAVGNYSVIGHNTGGLGTASFSIGVLATSAPTAVPTSTPTPPPTPTPTSSSGHKYVLSAHSGTPWWSDNNPIHSICPDFVHTSYCGELHQLQYCNNRPHNQLVS